VKYPALFKKWRKIVKREIKKHNIKVIPKRYRSNVGTAWAWLRTIKIPRIVDIESIYVILHEIAHIIYNHQSNYYMEELEAEMYALAFLRSMNVHKDFPEDYKLLHNRAIAYVRLQISNAFRDGLKIKAIPVKVMKFCKLPVKPKPIKAKKKSAKRYKNIKKQK